MSTELVAIERITIRKGDSNADDIRSCLAHYLLQFINSASIESLSMHKLSIKVDGKTVLFVQDKTGGVGLGLPLARRIARAHGGTLSLSSELGVGTTAKVELPLLL